MKRRIYLAAQFARRVELQTYRDELEDRGYIVTSRWLNGSHGTTDGNLKVRDHSIANPGRATCAIEDEQDIESADYFVTFTEEPYKLHRLLREYEDQPITLDMAIELMLAYPGTGGRHYETGYARRASKTIIVIGYREHVFHDMSHVIYFPTWQDCLNFFQPIND